MKRKYTITLYTIKILTNTGVWETLPVEVNQPKESKVVGVVRYQGKQGKEEFVKEIIVTE